MDKRKNRAKCVCLHEIIQLIIMKLEMKMKNRSQKDGINRPRSGHEHN